MNFNINEILLKDATLTVKLYSSQSCFPGTGILSSPSLLLNCVFPPCTVNSCLYTLCAVGAAGSASLCSEHINQTQWTAVVGDVTSPTSDTMCHSCAPVTQSIGQCILEQYSSLLYVAICVAERKGILKAMLQRLFSPSLTIVGFTQRFLPRKLYFSG